MYCLKEYFIWYGRYVAKYIIMMPPIWIHAYCNCNGEYRFDIDDRAVTWDRQDTRINF